MSGGLSGPEQKVIDNSFTYPYGTTEQFPQMEDSDLKELKNSAHYYMECSNKGTCDRATGECACFDGYDGVACQRASCPGAPNVCSGHGVCLSAAQIAASDSNNRYLLWDKDSTMGCKCDAGYYGPSCAEKKCKVGVDPLYLDDSATVKYSTYDFATLTTAPASAAGLTLGSYHTDDGVLLNDGTATGGRGYWAIRFFDATGEDWVTSPIVAGASCTTVKAALEALPNNVIPAGSTYCTRSWNIGQLDNEWSTTGGIGSTGATLYDEQHPASSAHPYKINYRMSIWDAYASSDSYEDIGEGGLYTSLAKYPGSFGVKPAVISVVGAAQASAVNIFTTANAGYEVGMMVTKVVSAGTATAFGVVSAVNVATTIAGVNTYTVTFAGTAITFAATDVIVGQTPTVSGSAKDAASSNTVTTLTPGFKAGMYLSVDGATPVLITSVTSETTTSTPYITTYTLAASSITATAGKSLRAFGTYTVSGVLLAATLTASTTITTTTLGFSIGMLVSLNGASRRIDSISLTGTTYTITLLEALPAGIIAANTPITGTTAASSTIAIAAVAALVGGNAIALTTTQTATVYASNYCGTISAGMIAGPSLTAKLPRVIRAATSNGAVFVGGTAGLASTTLTVAAGGDVKFGRLVTGMTISGTGIAEGTTVTCAKAIAAATVGSYVLASGTCTMSVANTIAASTIITATMPVVKFKMTIVSGVATITDVVQGPVVSGLLFERQTIATPLVSELYCPTPIGTGATGTCTAYLTADGTTATANMAATYVVASTYAPATSTCTIVVDGAATSTGTALATSDTVNVYPIFKGYTVSGTATSISNTNVVVTATTGFAAGMSLGCTGTCSLSSFITPRTITGVTSVGSGGGYSITFTGPSVTFAGDALTGSFVGAGFGETARVALTGYIYRLKFYGNPGALKQPEIVTHLDGKRNSLMSVNYAVIDPGTNKDYRVITKVWTDGQQGENNDYFADHCDGVQVTIGNKWVSTNGNDLSISSTGADSNQNTAAKFFLNSLTSAEKALLKKCLGDSDFDTTNNKDVYNWDWGYDETKGWDNPIRYPHLIKLVRSVTTYTDGGYYAAIYYSESDTLDSSGSGGTFYLLNPFSPPDAFTTDSYEVYTTKGTLALTSNKVSAYFGFGSKTIYTVDAREDPTKGATTSHDYNGDLSCKFGLSDVSRAQPNVQTKRKSDAWETAVTKTLTTTSEAYVCLNKTDIITFINVDYPAMNPPHMNLYTVNRLFKDVPRWSDYARWGAQSVTPTYLDTSYNQGHAMTYMTNQISLDISTNWGNSVSNNLNSLSGSGTTAAGGLAENSAFRIYKFYPAVASTYEYVAPCSNRGLCNTETGVCECFAGYTSDNCHEQSSLAL